MSDFFSDLEHAVRRMASSVSSEVSLAAQEQKVKEAFQTLGRMYYKAVQQGRTPEGADFDAQTAKIRAMLANINETRRNQNVSGDEFEDLT